MADVDDRVVVVHVEAAGVAGVAPVRAGVMRPHAQGVVGVAAAAPLGVGDVAGGLHERAELADGDLELAQVERPGDGHRVKRFVIPAGRVAGLVGRRAHDIGSGRNERVPDAGRVGELDQQLCPRP